MLDIHAPLILQGCTYFADKNVMKGSLLDNLQWYAYCIVPFPNSMCIVGTEKHWVLCIKLRKEFTRYEIISAFSVYGFVDFPGLML